jgi:hypothetical protein
MSSSAADGLLSLSRSPYSSYGHIAREAPSDMDKVGKDRAWAARLF